MVTAKSDLNGRLRARFLSELVVIEPGSVPGDEGALYLYDESGEEIVSWTETEWVEEPWVALAMVNAVHLLLTEGPDAVKAKVGR